MNRWDCGHRTSGYAQAIGTPDNRVICRECAESDPSVDKGAIYPAGATCPWTMPRAMTVREAALAMDVGAFIAWMRRTCSAAVRADWDARGVAEETRDWSARRAWEIIRAREGR